MPYKIITSTHNRLVGLFSGSTTLTGSAEIFGGLTADPSTFQFTKGFVDSGATATIGFGAAGITFTLPAGIHAFDDHGMAIGSTLCNQVTVTVSGSAFAILEFKGIPTTRSEDYFK
jgi:hypothetical protein